MSHLRRFAVAMTAAVLIAGFAAGEAAALPEVGEGRPNIVFVMVDDASAGMFEEMPQLQQLIVDQGATLNGFTYAQSLCCPSRATMLTGLYGQNTAVTANVPPSGGWDVFVAGGHHENTVGRWLDDAGYTTGYVGKVMNGYGLSDPTQVPPGWDDWFGVLGGVFDSYTYDVNDNGMVRSYGEAPEDYLTDVLADRAVSFLEGADSPFYLTLAPTAPHSPAVAAPRHEGMFEGVRAPRGAAFNEADVSDKPSAISTLPPVTPRSIDTAWRNKLRSLQAVDDAVGRIVRVLEAEGLRDNTFIAFASDNGYLLGQHRYTGKNTPYAGDTDSVAYVVGPGIEPASRVAPLVGNVDLPVTFAAMAGAATPTVDGRSMLPLLLGEDADWRNALPLTRDVTPTDKWQTAYRGLRTFHLTYVEYDNGEREFYDNRLDPKQLVNAYPEMDPALRDHLAARTAELAACSGETCRSADSGPLRP